MKGARQRAMRELLRQHGQMTVKQLSARLEVSEATIRRDLQELSGIAGLERMHGGATISDHSEPLVNVRRRDNSAVKMALARRAMDEVRPGATIFIGSGSTTACLAQCLLHSRELTVITNALNVALELAPAPGVSVILTGGAFRRGEMSLTGPIAQSTLKQTPFEVAFISAQGISADTGLSTAFTPEAATDRVVLEVAPRLVVLAEAHKLGRTAPICVGPAAAIDLLVTDAEPDDDECLRVAAQGVAVVPLRPPISV